jgi:1,2-diacylglycerol 3-alpha-glucosyltransferase
LIKAYALLADKHPKADLVLVGDGPERRSLEKLAQSLGVERRVHFTGFIDPSQVPLAYASATLLLFCSTSETQGLAIPESMACGLPPIVVKDPAYREIVKHGYNGVVAKRGAKGFAEAVSQTLDNPQLIKEMSKNAQKTAAQYSLVKSVDNLERLYHQLIIKK